MGVVEGRATMRCTEIGSGQDIDAPASFVRLVGMQAFRNDNIALDILNQPRMEDHFSTLIEHPNLRTLTDPKHLRGLLVDEQFRTPFFLLRRFRFRECGVQE